MSTEVLDERWCKDGTKLRREVEVHEDGSRGEPCWYLYYYEEIKPGVRRKRSRRLGAELPEEYR